MVSMIAESSIITASKEQVSSDLAGEVIILGLKSGSYFGLDGVGALIWSLIQKPISTQRSPKRSEPRISSLLFTIVNGSTGPDCSGFGSGGSEISTGSGPATMAASRDV